MPSRENRLLDLLPHRNRRALHQAGDVVDMGLAEQMYSAGQQIEQVFFPLSGAVSTFGAADDALETSMVGKEGMLGVPLILGVPTTPVRAVVVAAGEALRIESSRFLSVMHRSPPLRSLLGRYVHVLMGQLETSIACTRFHTATPRLARLLLMSHDRTNGDGMFLTQETLGRMLGIRRAGVTQSAIELSDDRLIAYTRGTIAVLDRRGLEAAACSCYGSNRALFQAHLSV